MKFIPDKIILIHEKFARDCLIMQAELALIKAKNDFVLRNLDILKEKNHLLNERIKEMTTKIFHQQH